MSAIHPIVTAIDLCLPSALSNMGLVLTQQDPKLVPRRSGCSGTFPIHSRPAPEPDGEHACVPITAKE